jgi:hypothetical protein
MSDENKPDLDVLSPALGITKEIDPARWAIQFDLEVQESIIGGWRKPDTSGMNKAEKREAMEDAAAQLAMHKQRAVDLKKSLAEYDKAPGNARITIRLMDPVKFTDLMSRRAILFGKSVREIDTMRARAEVDRDTIAWGVCGHEGVEVMGKSIAYASVKVDFDGERHTITHRSVVKEYERLGWRVSLPDAIVRFNRLSEEKKSG